MQYNELESYEELWIQSTSVSIKINSIPVTIFAVYCSSCHNIRQRNLQIFFNILSHSLRASVDFNSKYFLKGCYSNNPSGKSFRSTITNKTLSFISPSSLTYRPTRTNKHPDAISFFVPKLQNRINTNTKNICELSSDHSPIILSVGCAVVNIYPLQMDPSTGSNSKFEIWNSKFEIQKSKNSTKNTRRYWIRPGWTRQAD